MILSRDGVVAIMTPTKTGTRSLESAIAPKNSTLFDVVMPRHAKEAPGNARKVFIPIRHPYARLVSMYGYGRRAPHGWFIGKVEGTFEKFCAAWAKDRTERSRHGDWTSLMCEYVEANRHKKPRTFRLEDGSVREIQKALVRLDYPMDIVEKHINRSEHLAWEDYWTKKALDAIDDLLVPDLDLGSYIRPKRAL